MKVALVLKTNQGGLWAVPQLEELRGRGHDVVAVIPTGDGRLRRRLDDLGIPVRPVRHEFSVTSPVRSARVVREVRRVLVQERADVVFYHLIHSALISRAATLRMRVARVHMVAGPLYLESRKIAKAESLLARMDHRIIAGSEYTRRRYADLGIDAGRLTAVPYGVDTRRFSPGPDTRLEQLGVPKGTFVAAMVAYVYAPKSTVFPGVGIKGHDTLLAAWRRFATSRSDVHLALVGSGFDEAGEEHRRRLMREFDVENSAKVTWLDSVDDVSPVYNAADVSVAPSLSENHGSALESSAMGLPAIVSDAGALPEAVLDGRTGWVIPRGDEDAVHDALVAAYERHHAGRLQPMGDAARAHMKAQFELTDCARRVADIIEDAVRTR